LWVRRDSGAPDAPRLALDAARRDCDAAESDLARLSAPFRDARADERVTLADLRRALPQDSALVEWVRVRSSGARGLEGARDVALVLGPGASTRFVDLGESQAIDDAVQAWRAALASSFGVIVDPSATVAGSDPLAALRQEGERLRSKVFDPLRPLVGGARRLFLVPDGALHAVDLSALPDGDGRYLIETGPAIQILSTGRDLARFARPRTADDPAGRGLVAVGAPDFTASTEARAVALARARTPETHAGAAVFRGAPPPCIGPQRVAWTPLPESGREAERIAELFRGHERALVLTGAAASEERFKQEARGRRVLHLATHGFFLSETCGNAAGSDAEKIDNPLLLSGVVLAGAIAPAAPSPGSEDGILTAEEVAALDLRGVDLVTLSACDTGRGAVEAGEGVFGLRRAIEIAGARAVLMSLWPVQDRQASRFMTRFYRDRLAGTSVLDASRSATRAALDELRRQERPAHPYLWAGFVTAGDWH